MSLAATITILPPGQMLPVYLGLSGPALPDVYLPKIEGADLAPQHRTMFYLELDDNETFDRAIASPLFARDAASARSIPISDNANLDLLKFALSLFKRDFEYSTDTTVRAVEGSTDIFMSFKRGSQAFFERHPATKEIEKIVTDGLKRVARRLAGTRPNMGTNKYVQLGAHLANLFCLQVTTFVKYGFDPQIRADPAQFISAYRDTSRFINPRLVEGQNLKSAADIEHYLGITSKQWSAILVLIMEDLHTSEPYSNRAATLRDYIDYLILRKFMAQKMRSISPNSRDEDVLAIFDRWSQNLKKRYGLVPETVRPELIVSLVENFSQGNRRVLSLVSGFLSPIDDDSSVSSSRIPLDTTQFKRGMSLRAIVDKGYTLDPLSWALTIAMLSCYSLTLDTEASLPVAEAIQPTLNPSTQQLLRDTSVSVYLVGLALFASSGNRIHLNKTDLDYPAYAGSRNLPSLLISLSLSTAFGKLLSDAFSYGPNMISILLTTSGVGLYYWKVYEQAVFEERVLTAKFGISFRNFMRRTNRFLPKIPKGFFSGFFGGGSNKQDNDQKDE